MAKTKQQFCLHGHDIFITGRNTSGNCNECMREWNEDNYKINRDAILEQKKEYALTHKEEISIKNRNWRNEHREEVAEALKKYQEEHREEISQKKHDRYELMKEMGTLPSLTVIGKFNGAKAVAKYNCINFSLLIDEYEVLISKGCFYCGDSLVGVQGVSLDRLNDKDKSIGYSVGNVILCCLRCNRTRCNFWTSDEARVMIQAALLYRNINVSVLNNDYFKDFINDFKGNLELPLNIGQRLSSIRNRAIKKSINFELSREEFIQILSYPCFYCGILLKKGTSGNCDRISNDKNIGYKLGNLLPCCEKCNKTRNIYWTVEETKIMIQAALAYRNSK